MKQEILFFCLLKLDGEFCVGGFVFWGDYLTHDEFLDLKEVDGFFGGLDDLFEHWDESDYVVWVFVEGLGGVVGGVLLFFIRFFGVSLIIIDFLFRRH